MKRKGELIAAPPGEIFVPAGLKPETSPGPTVASGRPNGDTPHRGVLIVNADDWGRDYENTERTSNSPSGKRFFGERNGCTCRIREPRQPPREQN